VTARLERKREITRVATGLCDSIRGKVEGQTNDVNAHWFTAIAFGPFSHTTMSTEHIPTEQAVPHAQEDWSSHPDGPQNGHSDVDMNQAGSGTVGSPAHLPPSPVSPSKDIDYEPSNGGASEMDRRDRHDDQQPKVLSSSLVVCTSSSLRRLCSCWPDIRPLACNELSSVS
jgi:hypothetical protein